MIATEILKKEIDEACLKCFKDKGTYNKRIYEAMDYSLNAGGKRIRPILLLTTFMMYEDDYEKAMPVALALEMIQTYSLIHDDLPCMDDDDLRRGKPTSHKVFGEAIAVLAGDGLLNEALHLMLQYSAEHGAKAAKACSVISEAAGPEGMIGGQVVDILAEDRVIDQNELQYMHRKKTAALIISSIVSGAMLGGASKQDVELLRGYGEKLGLAFQIKDDILDVTGDTKLLGKKVKSDESNNKTTFITLYGLEQCKTISEKLTMECMEILSKLQRDTEQLKKITEFLLERTY